MNPILRLYGKTYSMFVRKYHEYRIARIREVAHIDNTAMITWDMSVNKNVYIGRKSSIGAGAQLRGGKKTLVYIGSYCVIGMNLHAYAATHDINMPVRTETESIGKIEADVVINDSCWIGDNVFIDAGVNIGNNCIIGTGAVVVSDIPPYSMAGGIPAKIIRKLSSGGCHEIL